MLDSVPWGGEGIKLHLLVMFAPSQICSQLPTWLSNQLTLLITIQWYLG